MSGVIRKKSPLKLIQATMPRLLTSGGKGVEKG